MKSGKTSTYNMLLGFRHEKAMITGHYKAIMRILLSPFVLLTLTCIGEVEGYCNLRCSVCLCMNKGFGQLTTLGLQSSYQKTWSYTRIKIRQGKPFDYKVMTIFTTHNCHFIWRLLEQKSTWKHNLSFLKAITFESQLEIKYNWSSGCYNIELALNFHVFNFMFVIEAKKT